MTPPRSEREIQLEERINAALIVLNSDTPGRRFDFELSTIYAERIRKSRDILEGRKPE